MDRRLYIIPAIVSLGVHGLLLIGTPTQNERETIVSNGATITDNPIPPEDIFILPPENEPKDKDLLVNSPAPRLGEIPPSLEELLGEPLPNQFTIEVPTDRPAPTTTNAMVIGPIGLPDGALDGVGIVSVKLTALSTKDLDHTPSARVQSSPRYPHNARAEGRNGEVLVEFVVNERGEVIKVSIIKSSDPIFEEATRDAVYRWRFAPGLKNGKPVTFKMRVPVAFNINNA